VGVQAAMACLDLAALYLRLGHTEEACRLGSEMAPLFRAQDLQPHATAALRVIQQALKQQSATVALVMEVAKYLNRHSWAGAPPFQAGK
jgi:hypothetical protein